MCTLSFYFVPTCVVMLVCNEIKHLDKASQSRKLYSILKLSRLIAPCSLNRQTHIHKTCNTPKTPAPRPLKAAAYRLQWRGTPEHPHTHTYLPSRTVPPP